MNAQVVYHSMTGHSRKIAKAIGEALGVTARTTKEYYAKPNKDTLFIVSGIYGEKTAPDLLNFVKSLKDSSIKTAVLLSSCASGRTERADLVTALQDAGIAVHPERFVCPGSFLVFRLGRPNKADVQAAVEFIKHV